MEKRPKMLFQALYLCLLFLAIHRKENIQDQCTLDVLLLLMLYYHSEVLEDLLQKLSVSHKGV